ncbi:transglutaminase family protein [Nocardioides ultimimeridianus]
MTRADLAHNGLRSALAAATTWVALTSWHGFVTYPSAYLLVAAALAAALALAGTLTPGRLGRRTCIAVDAVVGLLVVGWAASGSPVPGAGHSPARALGDGLQAASDYRVPLDHSLPSLTPLLVLVCAIFLVVVQALAVHLRRPSLAGLALLAVFALPAGFTGLGSSAPAFAGAAAGYLAVLVLDARDRQQHWGRRTTDPTTGQLRALRSAAPTTLAAIVVAVLVGAILPLPDDGLLHLNGDGGSGVTIIRPLIDMRRDLTRGEDVPLVDLITDDPDPGYLRIAVLNRFTGDVWSSGDRNVDPARTARGPVPLPAGLSPAVPRTSYQEQARILPEFSSTWLPTDYPIDAISAPGDWRYDPTTMDFIAGKDTNASGSVYSMTAVRLDYGTDGSFFKDAAAGAVPAEDSYVPATVPASVRDLAEQVTERATDDYQRALLLQDFFRVSGHFQYSLQRAPEGTVGQTMETFLSTRPGGRIGYCEQFASAMALMARIVGIPARVAVGFLVPDRIGPDSWEYSSHDLHAWPELYFADAGWVRFEPTPAGRAKEVPAYSVVTVPGQNKPGSPSTQPTEQPSDGSSGGPTATVQPSTGPRKVPEPTPTGGGGTESTTSYWWLAWTLAVTLVVMAAAALPSLVRRRRRERRLAGDAEQLWTEVRATATDLAIAWPEDRSPHEVADRLAPVVGRGEPSAALRVLADAVSELRYGSPARAVAVATRTDIAPAATQVIAALEASVTPRRRRWARWAPASLLTR